jgi:hypothetical protein
MCSPCRIAVELQPGHFERSQDVAIKDVDGKRTGRPRGAKSSSKVLRDIRAAYRSLDKPESKLTTAGARLWAAMAREHPAQFLACLAKLEARAPNEVKRDREAKDPLLSGDGAKPPRRVRTMVVDAQHLVSRMTSDGAAKLSNFPRDAYVAGCQEDPTRDGIVLVIHSNTFPPVFDGEVIPEITAEYSR